MTGEQLRNFLAGLGIDSAAVKLRDANYVCPAEAWLVGDFAEGFRNLRPQFDLERWEQDIGDCDDFSMLAHFYASFLHRATFRAVLREHAQAQEETPVYRALAFGTFDYLVESNALMGHSINCALVMDYSGAPSSAEAEGMPKLVFLEPQMPWGRTMKVDLTEGEICSCFEVRF